MGRRYGLGRASSGLDRVRYVALAREITLYFWIIQILCTTIGESAAADVNETLGFGLGPTAAPSAICSGLIALRAGSASARSSRAWPF